MNLDTNAVHPPRACRCLRHRLHHVRGRRGPQTSGTRDPLASFILAPLVQWLVRRGLPRSSSVALVLILVFTVLGGVTYVVGDQFASLADQLPTYQANIKKKLVALRPQNDSALEKARQAVSSIERSLRPAEADYATPVRVVSENATVVQLQSVLGPFHLTLAFGGVVLLLLVFVLIESNDISDRIVQMVGWGKNRCHHKNHDPDRSCSEPLSGNTVLFNLAFGVVIGLGLWAIGLPSPALWGLLAASSF